MQDVIIQGDVLTELSKIESDSIDLVITSPPYNKGNETPPSNTTWTGKKDMSIKYDSSDDDIDEEAYRFWQRAVLTECERVIKPTGSIFYNHKPRRINGLISLPSNWLWGFNIYQVIIWDRGNTPQVNDFCFYPVTEHFYWLVKGKQRPKFYRERAIWETEVWRWTPVSNYEHPAPFTPRIVRNIILTCSDEGDVVLDPFCGIGTACIQAKELGRHYIGIDISPQYTAIAHNKLSRTVTDKKAIAKQNKLDVER
jgi:modification methylase